jgi:hypothetical protein
MYPPDNEPCTCTTFRKCSYHAEQERKREAENRKHRPNPNPPSVNDTIDSMIRGAKRYPGPKEEADNLIGLLEDLKK